METRPCEVRREKFDSIARFRYLVNRRILQSDRIAGQRETGLASRPSLLGNELGPLAPQMGSSADEIHLMYVVEDR